MSGATKHAIVGPLPRNKGFHCVQPSSTAGMVLYNTIDGKVQTLLRANELYKVVSCGLRTSHVDAIALCECAPHIPSVLQQLLIRNPATSHIHGSHLFAAKRSKQNRSLLSAAP